MKKSTSTKKTAKTTTTKRPKPYERGGYVDPDTAPVAAVRAEFKRCCRELVDLNEIITDLRASLAEASGPIPCVPTAPKAAADDDAIVRADLECARKIHTLADLGITPAEALALASETHTTDTYDAEIALAGRILHDSLGMRVVIIADLLNEDEEGTVGQVFVIQPVVEPPGPGCARHRIGYGAKGIGFVSSTRAGRFFDNHAMEIETFAESLAEVLPGTSKAHARRHYDEQMKRAREMHAKAVSA